MNGVDVFIVGGGPAGIATALALDSGQRTLIADQRKAPWRKPCDGVLTPASQSVLKAIGIDPIRDFGARPVPALRVIDSDNGRESEITLSGHVIVPRSALDERLQRLAKARDNIRFLDSTRVLRICPHGEGFAIEVLREGRCVEIRPRLLVDASGAFGF